MYKEEKHIAISLLLVFIIPIIYQPVHIVRHHSQKEHDCSHGIYRVVKNPDIPVVQENEHCFICEYEFTVTNLPDLFDIPVVEAFVSELIPAKIQDIFSFEIILHTSPRAPPFFA